MLGICLYGRQDCAIDTAMPDLLIIQEALKAASGEAYNYSFLIFFYIEKRSTQNGTYYAS